MTDAKTIVTRGIDLRLVWTEVMLPSMRERVRDRAVSKLDAAFPEELANQTWSSREAAVEALVEAAKERTRAVFRPKT